MKNNKGFTLVEILAMLLVLGIIVAITIPNITGILSGQKENVYIEDAYGLNPDNASPLIIAPIACSLTPKKMFFPE